MNKQLKILLTIAMVFVLSIVLAGCSNKQAASDANNKYKLPLGDSGYLAEMDFDLAKQEQKTDSEGNDIGTISYDYIVFGSESIVTLTARVMEDNYKDKAVKLSVGYYENKEFKNVVDDAVFKLTNAFTDYSYNFTLSSDYENKKDEIVLKLSFGTAVDEEMFKNENPNATKKEIRNYVKQFQACLLKVNKLNIASNNLLVEKIKLGDVESDITKENKDLYYYNTAVVEYASETLTLKLNSKTGWWQWIIKELGKVLSWTTSLVGGNYWLGLLIFTIVLRTAGWPIYAKSNSFTNNMSKIQPEMEKLNKKYEGKTDQNSKMKQQMEMRQLMKKNHVSMWGCLLPFAQMPIFFAVYQVVQRFPLTPIYSGFNYKFLWTTFAMEYGEASGDWILAILVGLTMIGSQELTMYMTKRAQRKKANFYTAKNQQNNGSMRIMMIVMTVMMVVFAWKSAGIAFYWIIGNTYQIAQTMISKLQEEKRSEKEMLTSGKARGR